MYSRFTELFGLKQLLDVAENESGETKKVKLGATNQKNRLKLDKKAL